MGAVRVNSQHGVPLTEEGRNRQIIALHKEGLTQSEIGGLFGLSQRGVSKILGIEPSAKINISQILRERFTTDQTQAEIAKNYGVNQSGKDLEKLIARKLPLTNEESHQKLPHLPAR